MGEGQAYARLYDLLFLGVILGALLFWLLPKPSSLRRDFLSKAGGWFILAACWTPWLVLYLLSTSLYSVDNTEFVAVFAGVTTVLLILAYGLGDRLPLLARVVFAHAAVWGGFLLAIPAMQFLISRDVL
ncbi:hypothetical protein [Deinococcus marmoris]|uniref:Uncharacterized protein n=1 Tax=Deinococcus marmoris TaxID=249408 RepID=A0A1U7NZ15_9DEIO|nr:hypothetical protein [Deinococcus marmoris]OLV18159.1 hypothetical protein BOO71_0006688 [Deinococcus marmoris]